MPSRVSESYRATIEPQWSEVERVRDFVALWTLGLLRDPVVRDSVALATTELLENAVRHGAPGATIDFSLDFDAGVPRIRVANSLAPGSNGAEELEARLAAIAATQRRTAYQDQLWRIYRGESHGMGLVRVAYEGDFNLSCRLIPPDRIEVEVVTGPDRERVRVRRP